VAVKKNAFSKIFTQEKGTTEASVEKTRKRPGKAEIKPK